MEQEAWLNIQTDDTIVGAYNVNYLVVAGGGGGGYGTDNGGGGGGAGGFRTGHVCLYFQVNRSQ